MPTTTSKQIMNVPIITATTGETEPRLNEQWSVEYLERFTTRGDEIADRIMQILYAEGRADAAQSGNPADRPRRILQFLNLLVNRMSIPDPEVEHPFATEDPNYTFSPEVREAMRAFLRDASHLPAWADFDLIAKGQALFSDNPLLAYPVLAFLSIPVLYTCGRGGTQVLILTDQINTKVRRRLVETGTLIMQVMQKDSFTKLPENSKLTNPLAMAIEGILRVRLLHAASRTVIHEFWQDGVRDRAAEAGKPDDVPSKVRQYHGKPADQMWEKEWGIPIHQQYLAGTLMTFSFIDLYGLEKLGVLVSDEDKRAYMHIWNVFGYVLGIEEELLLRLDFPRTNRAVFDEDGPVHAASGEEMVASGRVLYTRVMQLNRANDPEAIRCGRILTTAILDYLGDVLLRRVPGGKYLRVNRLPNMMMGMLLSNDDRELLGVSMSILDRLLFPIVLLILRLRGLVAKSIGFPANILAHVFFKYMQEENEAVYDELEKNTGVRYPGIPEEFQKKWGLIQ
jgi:hypothetical protein